MKVARWNMRCKLDLQRVGSALETGNLDILMFSDCQLRRMPTGEVEVASLDVSLPESAGTAFTVVYFRCVVIATRYKILKHTLPAFVRILWADCMCERNERIRFLQQVPPADLKSIDDPDQLAQAGDYRSIFIFIFIYLYLFIFIYIYIYIYEIPR